MGATRGDLLQTLGQAICAKHYDVAERIMAHLGMTLDDNGEIINEFGQPTGMWYENSLEVRRRQMQKAGRDHR